MTIAEFWRELRYHAIKHPDRVYIRRDDNDGWTVRLTARKRTCDFIWIEVNSMISCTAFYGLPIGKFRRIICHISSDLTNEKERAMMDNAAEGKW